MKGNKTFHSLREREREEAGLNYLRSGFTYCLKSIEMIKHAETKDKPEIEIKVSDDVSLEIFGGKKDGGDCSRGDVMKYWESRV